MPPNAAEPSSRSTRRLGLIVIALAALLVGRGAPRLSNAQAPAGLTASIPPRLMGYNLDYPGDWTNLPPFIDLMKNSRGFSGSCSSADPGCDATSHLNLDAKGWVRSLRYRDNSALAYSDIITYINTSSDRYDIGQSFVVTWDGLGDISVGNGGDVQVNAAARRITFTLRAGNTFLRLSNIDPAQTGNHLRHIKVFAQDYEALANAGQVFNPDMLRWLAPFRSIRFMDWMQSNSYGQCSGGTEHGRECYAVIDSGCGGGTCVMPGEWSQRPTQDQASWISWGQYLDNAAPQLGTRVGGYPAEVMVALANVRHSHPHFNMPAAFTEEYVRNFAELVRAGLAPDLIASVEYSNEVWNWGFPQANYAHALGQEAWPGLGSAWVQFAAGRTHEMCRIWKQVFAGQEHRMRCLISPQTGWPGLAETVLNCPAWATSHPPEANCTRYVDAINITGYFSGCLWDAESTIVAWLAEGNASALNRGFQQLNHGGSIVDCDDNLDATIEAYSFFKGLAAARGLSLNVYEGGTHFSYYGENQAVTEFLVDMARDPRMYAAYRRNFEGYWRAGGSTFNNWGWIEPNDPWSHADHALDFDQPKYRAIVDAGRSILPLPWRPKVFGCGLTSLEQ